MSQKTMTRRDLTKLMGAATAVAAISGVATPAAAAFQPRMDAALAHLNSALFELEHAIPNKGGHRINAINLVKAAKAEVQKGIHFANTH